MLSSLAFGGFHIKEVKIISSDAAAASVMKAFSLIPILPFSHPIVSQGWSHHVCRGSVLALGLRENKKNNISNRKLFSTAQRQLHQQQQHPYKSYTMPQGSADKGTGGSPATAYIALGSNLGDRIGWIEKACKEMDARGIRVKRTSSLWETKPMYVLDQDSFVNGACEVMHLSSCHQPARLSLLVRASPCQHVP